MIHKTFPTYEHDYAAEFGNQFSPSQRDRDTTITTKGVAPQKQKITIFWKK